MGQTKWSSARIVGIEKIGETYSCLTLEASPEFKHKAGQYSAIKILDEEGEFGAYYSIASAPSEVGLIEFCIIPDQNPRLRNFFSGVEVGGTVEIASPASAKFDMSLIRRSAAFIAGGSGIAPLRAMIQDLSTRKGNFSYSLLFGCRSAEEIPYLDEFEELVVRDHRFSVTFCAENGDRDGVRKGRIDSYIGESVSAEVDYFLCGPPKMLEVACDALRSHGVSDSELFFEGF